MRDTLQYLLLQVRNTADPMREHEVHCFARALRCSASQVRVFDLLSGRPSRHELDAADVVLLGGSGEYSVAEGGPWLKSALDAMRELHAMAKPTFASCWGFQAMASAMGGSVVHDLSRAEVGTHTVRLTTAGEQDPVFSPLGKTFRAQLGHHDFVDRLPDDATLLASTDRSKNQAFRFSGLPMYCTQFHPELNLALLLDRLRTYPKYVETIAGVPFDEFVKTCAESIETGTLLLRFVEHLFGPSPKT